MVFGRVAMLKLFFLSLKFLASFDQFVPQVFHCQGKHVYPMTIKADHKQINLHKKKLKNHMLTWKVSAMRYEP